MIWKKNIYNKLQYDFLIDNELLSWFKFHNMAPRYPKVRLIALVLGLGSNKILLLLLKS